MQHYTRGTMQRRETDGMPDSRKASMHHYEGTGSLKYNQVFPQNFPHQVCSPSPESVCKEEFDSNCSLVQDVVCRNVTETR